MAEEVRRYDTHVVFNQPPPLEEYNAFETDTCLSGNVQRVGGDWAIDTLVAMGKKTGGRALIELGFLANENRPELRTHDRYGHRIDQVKFHPAWHQLMAFGIHNQIHALPWRNRKQATHVVRAARHYLLSQVEAGVGCPLTMSFAAVPVLKSQPDVGKIWVNRLLSSHYDPTFAPIKEKEGCIVGMAMTEKQGGSDVRANMSQATPLGCGGPGMDYHLTGHKWFCSAPMSDAFLTLARTELGLSCFLVPRWTPEDKPNRIFIQRLKNKLGNRSNASCEIEYDRSWATMIGEEGRGIRTIIEMVNHTRLDCVIGSSALMRQALVQAIHHCYHRAAFGKKLVELPLMEQVLADLSLESEAATTLMIHLAEAYDLSSKSPAHCAYARLVSAIGKYWVCKRTSAMVGEALECLGGAGFVEESIFPRLYREAPLCSIWEGSGNVMCLDVLRALKNEPDAAIMLRERLTAATGQSKTYDRFLKRLRTILGSEEVHEHEARFLVERLALALQGSLLLELAPNNVSTAFCHGRLGRDRSLAYGAGPEILDRKLIIRRAFSGS